MIRPERVTAVKAGLELEVLVMIQYSDPVTSWEGTQSDKRVHVHLHLFCYLIVHEIVLCLVITIPH